jgi:DNA-binding HxlR family transcriptional regulator
MRSACPINLATEVLGDRWSLVILRDIIFGGRRTYRELLTQSLEGIATNILASRLRHLESEGFLSAARDPGHSQRTIYSLTEKAIALVPVLAALGDWGVRFLPVTPPMASRAKALAAGGPPMWQAFMDELREMHLGIARPVGSPSVLSALDAAFRRTERRSAAAAKRVQRA